MNHHGFLDHMSPNATFTSAFVANEREARANIIAAPDQVWADFWARQAFFWARMQRFVQGEA